MPSSHLIVLPSIALAHGRFPVSTQILQTDDAWVVNTTFGLVLSHDEGETWKWVCRPAMFTLSAEDPTFLLTKDSILFGATFGGLIRGNAKGCQWQSPSAELESIVVIDVVKHEESLYALTSPGEHPGRLYRSIDQGITWEPASPPIESTLLERVRIAPNQSERIYLSGSVPGNGFDQPRQPFVHRSNDGGQTWERFPFSFEGEEHNIFLLAVHPLNPDIVFMKVLHPRDRPDIPDRLVRSDDGGEHWRTVLRVVDLQGFAINDTGTNLWVGGQGLWRSEDGEHFLLVREDLSIGCLSLHNESLWACGENYRNGFAAARSRDGGEHFTTFLRYQDMVGPVECENEIESPECQIANEDIVRDLLSEPCDAGPCPDAEIFLDGAMNDADPTTPIDPTNGCTGCATSNQRFPLGGFLIILLIWHWRY